MAKGLQALFPLRYEDYRKVWIMGSVFLLAGISEMINYTSFMAIFNSRVGTQFLPMMYLIEAVLLPLEGWLLSYFSQRVAKPRFMVSLYTFFIGIGLVNGTVLLIFYYSAIEWLGFYILLFLASNFVIRQQTLLMWSTAFDLCPTQQVKRVMPVFVLAAIVGGIIAGVVSHSFAPLLGPEWLYMLAAILLLLGLPSFQRSIKQYLLPLTLKKTEETESLESVASSSYYVKESLRSPFLLTVMGIMTLMPAVYFLIEYQYFTSAQAVFPNEAELTAFYGLMVIILFGAALILQLFATKLMDWLGASNTIFAISVIFFVCFLFVSSLVNSDLALVVVSIGYSLIYLLLYYFAEPSYQFFFKMLPISHRDGFRFTVQGIAASAGILLGSALSMLHSELGVSLTGQALLGSAAAACLLLLAWISRHLYMKELVRHLQVHTDTAKNYMSEFLESMNNERMKRALIKQLDHPNEAVQRFTLDLLTRHPNPEASTRLWQYAAEHTGDRRALGISAIHLDGWRGLSEQQQEALLLDEDERVRVIAYRHLLAVHDQSDSMKRQRLIERARMDVSMHVRAESWKVMEDSALLQKDLRQLIAQGKDAAVLACELIGLRKLRSMDGDVMTCLLSLTPTVKLTAVRTIGKIGDSQVAASLMEMLVGADKELRLAIEAACLDVGSTMMPELTRFISSPNDEIWRSAVKVANAIGTDEEIRDLVVPSCVQKLRALSASNAVVKRIEATGKTEWTRLAKARVEEITVGLLDTIWEVMVRFGDERAIPRLRQAVEDPDEEIRDHGLEILSEGIGDQKLNTALLAFYRQSFEQGTRQTEEQLDADQVEVTDPWLQAIALKAGTTEGEALWMNNWEYLSALDKIVFLKQVPLFQEISIEELGRIASIAQEKTYGDGDPLILQGEVSTSLIVIIEGQVEVSGSNDNGTEGTIGILGAKQTIGEAGLFDQRPSLVSAHVLFQEARVLEIESKEAARLVRLYPDIGVGLLRSISQRLRTVEHMLLKLG